MWDIMACWHPKRTFGIFDVDADSIDAGDEVVGIADYGVDHFRCVVTEG